MKQTLHPQPAPIPSKTARRLAARALARPAGDFGTARRYWARLAAPPEPPARPTGQPQVTQLRLF